MTRDAMRPAGTLHCLSTLFIRRRLVCLTIWTALLTAVASLPAHADSDSALIDALGKRVILVLKKEQDAEQRRVEFENILSDFFDLREIARLVLGRHWRKAEPHQQERYLELFGRYVVAVYAGQFGNYGGQTFTVVQSRAIGQSESLVSAEIRGEGGPPVFLNFRVHRTADGPRVVDVTVEGVSMLITMRDEFSSVVTREGIEGLLRRLEEKVATA